MDLTDINTLKSLLGHYRVHLSKKMGQHFLVDRQALERIVAAADLQKDDFVLEVGPGVGTMTALLSKAAGKVVAIEKDKRFIKILKSTLRKCENVEIIEGDILALNIPDLLARYKISRFKVVSNIPYNITGEIFRFFLSSKNRPEQMVLLVQKEVAQRAAAKAGAMSILAVSVQLFGDPEVVCLVPRSSFLPEPDVDSAIFKITTFKQPKYSVDEKDFFRIVKVGFAARRKTLENNLASGLLIGKDEASKMISTAGIKPQLRAQELGVEEWVRLCGAWLGSRKI